MVKLKTIRNSLLVSLPTNTILLMSWLEQVGAWFLTTSVDWNKLPWAFGAATIATLKAKKDANGNVIHKSFSEWSIIAISGTFIAMASWKDVLNFTKLSPELSTVIAGLIGWLLADIIIKKAKEQLSSDDKSPLKP